MSYEKTGLLEFVEGKWKFVATEGFSSAAGRVVDNGPGEPQETHLYNESYRWINVIKPDSRGRVWVGTQSGLACFVPHGHRLAGKRRPTSRSSRRRQAAPLSLVVRYVHSRCCPINSYLLRDASKMDRLMKRLGEPCSVNSNGSHRVQVALAGRRMGFLPAFPESLATCGIPPTIRLSFPSTRGNCLSLASRWSRRRTQTPR